MKTTPPHTGRQNAARCFKAVEPLKSIIAIFALAWASLPVTSFAGAGTWNGSTSPDWNTAANWTGGVPSAGDAFISTTTPNIATISNNISATPVDIKVGWSGNGRVDHISGNAGTGNGNWMWLGIVGNQAIYNFADTRTTGGTFTGYGQGSGNLNVGGASQNGNLLLGLDNGTVSTLNVNSSGTITGAGLYAGANGGANGIVNMDSGTLNFSGEVQIGANFFNQGSGVNNQLNVSGGTLTADIIGFARGANNAAAMKGSANVVGGTLNSKRWFTLGFAGSASNMAAVTNNGGTINVKTVGPDGVLEMGVYDATANQLAVNSGSVNLQNSASIVFGSGGNHTGTSAFTQNGGTVTFYSDAGTTIGGTGSLNLGSGGSTGTYTYDLNGGILTVPKIQKTASSASGTFNFNGGTLRAAASTTTFMQSLTTANVQSGGAIIDTANFDISIAQTLQAAGGGLTKVGSGKLTLAGGYGFTGATLVKAGTLALDTAATSSGNNITVSNATLSVSLNNGSSSLAVGSLTFTGNSALGFDFGTATAPTAAAITASGVSVSGTNTINIAGAFLVVGQYPLIFTGSSVPTNNFKLGTLPTGVSATLANSGNSLDLVVTATGQNLTWYGADSGGTPLTTWNISTSSNWNSGTNKYLQYAGNSYGDVVTFDDSLFAGSGNVNLAVRVVPAAVTFNNSAQSYTLTGTGGIDGNTSLVLANSGSLYLGTSNNFTGGTVISGGGTLTITNNSALGASAGGVTLAGTLEIDGTTTSSRPINISGTSALIAGTGAIVQLSGGVTNSGASSFNAVSSASLQLNGPVVTSADITFNVAGSSAGQFGGLVTGTGGLTKTGDGILTFAGGYTATGQFLVNGGTGVVSSVVAPGGSEVWVGSGSGNSGTVNVNAGGILTSANWLVVGRDGGTGTINVNGGVISNTAANFTIANTAAAVGTVNLNSGTAAVNGELWIGENGTAVLKQSGGTNNTRGFYVIGRNNGAKGTNTISGGTVNAATAFGFTTLCSAEGVTGALEVTGGKFNSPNGILVGEGYFAASGTAAGYLTVVGPGLINTGPDGGITLAVQNNSAGTINLFSGGTIQTRQISQGTGAGGGAFYFNGGTLKATTNNTTFMQGLTTVQVLASGAIIDTAGNDVGIAQALLDAGVGGGLTKTGNGALALNGVNTYTGATVVNAGTLVGTGAIAGAVTVNSGAGLAPGDSIGTLTINGNITLSAGSTNVFEVDGSTPANDSVIAGGSVAYGGALKIVPTGSFTVGQQFQLFSGAGATNAGNFASVQSTTATTFSFTNGVLKVLSSVASNPTNITFSASGNILTLSWPADHLGWTLYTNIAGVSATSQWFPLPGSSSVTTTNLAINPSRTNVFFRLQNQ